MSKVVDPKDLQRCPDCGEAIRCDVPIPCLNQFHEQEPEKIVKPGCERMYNALTVVLDLGIPFS